MEPGQNGVYGQLAHLLVKAGKKRGQELAQTLNPLMEAGFA